MNGPCRCYREIPTQLRRSVMKDFYALRCQRDEYHAIATELEARAAELAEALHRVMRACDEGDYYNDTGVFEPAEAALKRWEEAE